VQGKEHDPTTVRSTVNTIRNPLIHSLVRRTSGVTAFDRYRPVVPPPKLAWLAESGAGGSESMNDDGASPIFSRGKAAECRENASKMRNRAMAATDADLRQALIEIADQWDILAAEIEKRHDRPPG